LAQKRGKNYPKLQIMIKNDQKWPKNGEKLPFFACKVPKLSMGHKGAPREGQNLKIWVLGCTNSYVSSGRHVETFLLWHFNFDFWINSLWSPLVDFWKNGSDRNKTE